MLHLRPDPIKHLITYTGVQTGSMYKKPPDEDRTREYPEITYPAQRRKRPVATHKQPSETFYADEHPEIPRVRRASLNLDQQPTRPSPGSESIQEAEVDQDTI